MRFKTLTKIKNKLVGTEFVHSVFGASLFFLVCFSSPHGHGTSLFQLLPSNPYKIIKYLLVSLHSHSCSFYVSCPMLLKKPENSLAGSMAYRMLAIPQKVLRPFFRHLDLEDSCCLLTDFHNIF